MIAAAVCAHFSLSGAAPTALPASECDVAALPQQLEAVTRTCCPTGCLLTGSSVCSVACAEVLLPLLRSCSAELTAAGGTAASLGAFGTALGPTCERAISDSSPTEVGMACGYTDLMPVTMACASYLRLSSAALEHDAAFCYSLCLEQAQEFHKRCAAEMSYTMKLSLGAVETELDKPTPMCKTSSGGYDTEDTVICEGSGAAVAVNAACADASSMLGDPTVADDPLAAFCNSPCSKSVAALSSACKRDPLFSQAIGLEAACKDLHETGQCTDLKGTFDNIVTAECCGSNGVTSL